MTTSWLTRLRVLMRLRRKHKPAWYSPSCSMCKVHFRLAPFDFPAFSHPLAMREVRRDVSV